MGMVAFGLLQCGELGVAVVAFGRTIHNYNLGQLQVRSASLDRSYSPFFLSIGRGNGPLVSLESIIPSAILGWVRKASISACLVYIKKNHFDRHVMATSWKRHNAYLACQLRLVRRVPLACVVIDQRERTIAIRVRLATPVCPGS
jgi:hypothetical protein